MKNLPHLNCGRLWITTWVLPASLNDARSRPESAYGLVAQSQSRPHRAKAHASQHCFIHLCQPTPFPTPLSAFETCFPSAVPFPSTRTGSCWRLFTAALALRLPRVEHFSSGFLAPLPQPTTAHHQAKHSPLHCIRLLSISQVYRMSPVW